MTIICCESSAVKKKKREFLPSKFVESGTIVIKGGNLHSEWC